VLPAASGLVLAGAVFLISTHLGPGANRAVVAGLWIFPLAFIVSAVFDLMNTSRFRMQIDPDLVSYQGAFVHWSYPRAEVVRLATSPWARGSPGSLLFLDSEKQVLFRVDRSLLTADQEVEISRALDMPIERTSAR
jgi:hypothetical protein